MFFFLLVMGLYKLRIFSIQEVNGNVFQVNIMTMLKLNIMIMSKLFDNI